jgi:hypothetical protein
MLKKSYIAVDPGVAAEVIKLFKEQDHGLGGDTGPWHGPHLRGCSYPWFQATYDRVAAAVAPLKIDVWWFNCGEKGDEYSWHVHRPCDWAGVLYVQVPENSGGIEFRKSEEYDVFQPQAGDFIQFSGNLEHRAQANLSDNYRINVSFNFKP